MRGLEFKDNLGNVLVTISDKKIGVDANADGIIDYYNADVVTANDYFPFGMTMPGRKYTQPSLGVPYRYGFNGKENDKETSSTTTYDYGFRIYNPALGRFLSVDPLTKSYPWNSTYAFAENDVIRCIDLDGLEKYVVTNYYNRFNQLTETLITIVTDKESGEKQDMKLKYDRGRRKGESVSQGYDVLVRDINQNAQGTITTTYRRKRENQLTPQENRIINRAPKEIVEGTNALPGFGGSDLDGGESITGAEPGFDQALFELAGYRATFNPVPPPVRRPVPPPTQNQINTGAGNLLGAGIIPDQNTILPAARTAANNLGTLLSTAQGRSVTLNFTFFDPTGTNSFLSRPASNGSTFGSNVNQQLRTMANIIQRLSGKTVNFNLNVTTTRGNNGVTAQVNR